MLPESLICLGRIVALGQIGALARTRAQRPRSRASALMPHPALGSVSQMSASRMTRRISGCMASGERNGPLGANAASRGDSRSAMDTLASGSSRTAPRSRPGDRRAPTLAATASRSVRSVGAPRLARHRPASRFRLGSEPPAPAVDSQNREHGHGPSATLRIPCFARPAREATVSITRRRHGV